MPTARGWPRSKSDGVGSRRAFRNAGSGRRRADAAGEFLLCAGDKTSIRTAYSGVGGEFTTWLPDPPGRGESNLITGATPPLGRDASRPEARGILRRSRACSGSRRIWRFVCAGSLACAAEQAADRRQYAGRRYVPHVSPSVHPGNDLRFDWSDAR
jgi:hypothetical protein